MRREPLRQLRRAGCALAILISPWAAAQGAAGADAAAPDALAPKAPAAPSPKADAGPKNVQSATCIEHVPAGKERPSLSETFPKKGLSGYALPLKVVVKHGRGETVLPGGLRMRAGTDEARALERSEFILPHPDGGAGPVLATKEVADGSETTLELSLVALPKKPGRNELILPPLPIAVQRASGEVLTVCTQPHEIVVEDPIANTPEPEPKHNPAPRRQEEVWTTAKNVALGALTAAIIALLVALLLGRFLKREKKGPPPPPPRPPWEVGLEALADLERQELVERERLVEHFEQVTTILREYCGDRYGFDGLESTTREMLAILRRVIPPIAALDDIEKSLRRADLVKFARLTPDAEECTEALARARSIIERTIPPPLPNRAVQAPPGGTP